MSFRGGLRVAALAGALLVALAPAAARAEPENLGRLKEELTAYEASGAYAVELAEVVQQATLRLERRVAEAAAGERLAIVLDIDETSLSNWPEIAANDFAFLPQGPCTLDGTGRPSTPCGVLAWNDLAAAPAIRPVLGLAQRAAELGVALFFVTGREESARAGTEKNLRAVGYPAWERLYLRPEGSRTASAADYKTPLRAEIERQGYRIVLNLGDQVSDLAGGHAEAVYKLPNPFYLIR